MEKEKIKEKLTRLKYKVDFWYEKGQLDAVCIAKWVGDDLVHERTYAVDEIAEVLFDKFLLDTAGPSEKGEL